MKNVVYVLLILVLIAFGPLATIASLNTLFSLGIPYNIYTWLSVMWIGVLLNNNSYGRNK